MTKTETKNKKNKPPLFTEQGVGCLRLKRHADETAGLPAKKMRKNGERTAKQSKAKQSKAKQTAKPKAGAGRSSYLSIYLSSFFTRV
jgi:hypothetical protein